MQLSDYLSRIAKGEKLNLSEIDDMTRLANGLDETQKVWNMIPGTSIPHFREAMVDNGRFGAVLIGNPSGSNPNIYITGTQAQFRKGSSVISNMSNFVNDTKSATWSPAAAEQFAAGWADITGASVTLNLTTTCTVRVEALVTGYNSLNGSGRGFYYRSVVGGVADPATSFPFLGSMSPPTNLTLPYLYVPSGIAAGSVIVKLQCQADSGINESNFVTRGRLIATAYTE